MTWSEQFAPQAVRDVEGAVEWLASEAGVPVARRLVRSTLDAARQVTEQPGIGSMRPDLLPARFRTWRVRGFPYLIVYDAERAPVQVLRVLHMARDFPPLLEGLAGSGN